MTTSSIEVAASDNLRTTYFELGSASANARIWKEAGFTACIGDFDHPICNFAAGLDLNRQSATRLARVAVDRTSFNVYVTPQDRPLDVSRILIDQGFCRTFGLVQMVARATPSEPQNQLSRASTYYDRFQIAAFMVDQFFTKQGQQFRRQVADSTAKATTLELLALKRGGRILGATMVSFHHGIAGVYNVCVDSSLRSMGFGASILHEILAVCSQKNVAATLQCDPKLEPWYKQFGFARCGEIEVLSLTRPNGFVIMQ